MFGITAAEQAAKGKGMERAVDDYDDEDEEGGGEAAPPVAGGLMLRDYQLEVWFVFEGGGEYSGTTS